MSVLRDNVNTGPEGFRKLISSGMVISAGVYDGISSMIAQSEGFKCLYLSGSGVAGMMGLPDISLTTLTEVTDVVRTITSVTSLPLIVDTDTGFGETVNVTRTVREMEKAGAAAIHIEDQVLPKRCGHLSGKKVISKEEMGRKIRAATTSRRNPAFTIIARTDARSVNGLEDAIERAIFYGKCGADLIFTEALESEDEFREFASRVRVPLLANMTEFGKSPLLSVRELKEIGYAAVIFPLTGFRAAIQTLRTTYRDLIREGTQRNFIDRLMTRNQYYELLGYSDYEKDDSELFHSVGDINE